jgi:hypothetical protein
MAITAQAIVARIQQNLGSGWKDTSLDTFLAGNRDSEVKGVVTTFAPSLEVLRKAVAGGKNMIISRESPFWARPAAPGGRRGQAPMENDPIYRMKREYIAANNLIVYRFFDNWNARRPDAQLQGLAKALGWEKYYKPSAGEPWTTNNGFFAIPPATLKETAQIIKTTLKMKQSLHLQHRCPGCRHWEAEVAIEAAAEAVGGELPNRIPLTQSGIGCKITSDR